MSRFDPTTAPPGRLCRLGVVVDLSAPDVERVAKLADRAGLGVVWIADRLAPGPAPGDPPPAGDIWARASELGASVANAVLGVMVSMDGTDAERVARSAAELGRAGSGATEVAVDGRDAGAAVDAMRRAFEARPPDVRRPRLSAVAHTVADMRPLLDRVDDIVLEAWGFPDLETAADEARAEALEVGRDPASLGVAAVLPVSIGRTEAEASARADGDQLFAAMGHPRDIGIFGTLEECQDRVIALAHAGVTDLRVVLPGSPDVHDVIAQLTAMTVGTTDVLVPGALRSPAPPPPEGWGGRPDQPPRPRVSGGSRRR